MNKVVVIFCSMSLLSVLTFGLLGVITKDDIYEKLMIVSTVPAIFVLCWYLYEIWGGGL